LADPYYMYGTRTLAGLNELKPRVYRQVDLAKTRQIERIAPKSLVLGNSRSETGIDPASPLWPQDARPVFNAAIAGRGLFTARLMLREAIAVHPVQLALLSVDFDDFLGTPDWYNSHSLPGGAAERRLLVDRDGRPNPSRKWQILQDRFASTLSIDAVYDSFATLADQSQTSSVTLTPLGFNPLREYKLFAARIGYRGLFEQKQRAYFLQYSAYAKPDFSRSAANPGLHELRNILSVAHSNRIRLILFIPPYHSAYLKMVGKLGLWDAFERWKRLLVYCMDDVSVGSSKEAVQLIDFSGFNRYTTESVPAAGDYSSAMQWYWEPGHYKAELGDHILRRVFAGETDFGRSLTVASIDQALQEMRDEARPYLDGVAAATVNSTR
jgi:hypothetical protein